MSAQFWIRRYVEQKPVNRLVVIVHQLFASATIAGQYAGNQFVGWQRTTGHQGPLAASFPQR